MKSQQFKGKAIYCPQGKADRSELPANCVDRDYNMFR